MTDAEVTEVLNNAINMSPQTGAEKLWSMTEDENDAGSYFCLGRLYEVHASDYPKDVIGSGPLHVGILYGLNLPIFASVASLYKAVVSQQDITAFRLCVDTSLWAYGKAIDMQPDWDFPLVMRGQLLKSLQEKEKAKEDLLRAVETARAPGTKKVAHDALNDLNTDISSTLARLAQGMPVPDISRQLLDHKAAPIQTLARIAQKHGIGTSHSQTNEKAEGTVGRKRPWWNCWRHRK